MQILLRRRFMIDLLEAFQVFVHVCHRETLLTIVSKRDSLRWRVAIQRRMRDKTSFRVGFLVDVHVGKCRVDTLFSTRHPRQGCCTRGHLQTHSTNELNHISEQDWTYVFVINQSSIRRGRRNVRPAGLLRFQWLLTRCRWTTAATAENEQDKEAQENDEKQDSGTE